MDNKKSLVYVSAFTYALIVGLSFLFNKVALISSNPLDVLAYRFTAGFVVVLLALVSGKLKLNYNKESIKRILPLALLYPLLFFTFQTFGLQYASSSEAGILTASAPVFTLIFASTFLNERTNILQKISIFISVLGVVYITLMKGASFDFSNIQGIILLLLSAVSMAGYSVLARVLLKDYSNIEISVMMIIISFLFFNLLSLGNHIIQGTLDTFFDPIFDIQFIGAILYLGILSSLVTSLLSNYVLSKIEASKMIVFSNLGTVISIVAGVVFLDEAIFYYHIIGSILIVGGVLGTNFLDKVSLKSK